MNDDQFEAYDAKCRRAAELRREILPRNKQVLFDTLVTVGIALVTIEFDGSGDSGQFEAAAGFDAANNHIAMTDVAITVAAVDFESSTVSDQTTTVCEFMEELACDVLEEKHADWENEDGAYGEFRFAVAERSIKLEYNERYMMSDYHEHEV